MTAEEWPPSWWPPAQAYGAQRDLRERAEAQRGLRSDLVILDEAVAVASTSTLFRRYHLGVWRA